MSTISGSPLSAAFLRRYLNRSPSLPSSVAAWTIGTILAMTLSLPGEARAQSAISVAAGAASYDLAGVGTSGVGAVRFEWPLASRLGGQVGTSFFWYGTQGVDQVAMLLPEVGVLARPSMSIPLLVGLGVGHSATVKGTASDEVSLYGALAFDIEDRAGWAVRPEMRVRVLDPWVGTIAEFTLGVRRRFGS